MSGILDVKRPDFTDPRTMRYKWRRRRFEIIERILRPIVEDRGEVSIIDIGGTHRYWSLLDPDLAPYCKVTLVNLGNWPRPKDVDLPKGLQIVDRVGDGCELSEFGDDEFDLAHSNSVIEHVGSLTRMAAFARELRRVGKNYYCQTPNLGFPIEPHYGVPMFHWLPATVRARLLSKYKIGWRKPFATYEEALVHADHTRLLDSVLVANLFPDATLYRERVAFLTKSLVAFRAEDVAIAA